MPSDSGLQRAGPGAPLLGCFFFGAFICKMLILTGRPPSCAAGHGRRRFSGLTALWMTAALWFFTTHGLTF
jgi:hypothetical protein